MKYEFDDGMVVDYSGSVHVTKGDQIDLYIESDFIPTKIRADLEEATHSGNKEKVGKIGWFLADTVGYKACLADIDSKACVNF